MTPQDVVGLLAEEHRMRVLAAIALGSLTHAEVVQAADVPSKAVSIALQRLVAVGLVTGGEALTVNYSALRELAAAASPRASGRASGRASDSDDEPLHPFVRGHRLVSLPAAPTRRHVVLEHITATTFQVGTDYAEPAVNDALSHWCEDGEVDHVALRRYLVDAELLVRRDGRYWRPNGVTPELSPAQSHLRALGLA